MARNDTRHMESVIAVFEELSFTLAAQKTRISQPMLRPCKVVDAPEEAGNESRCGGVFSQNPATTTFCR
jgi:hypothetical protein